MSSRINLYVFDSSTGTTKTNVTRLALDSIHSGVGAECNHFFGQLSAGGAADYFYRTSVPRRGCLLRRSTILLVIGLDRLSIHLCWIISLDWLQRKSWLRTNQRIPDLFRNWTDCLFDDYRGSVAVVTTRATLGFECRKPVIDSGQFKSVDGSQS